MQCSAAHAVDQKSGAVIDKPRDQVGVSLASRDQMGVTSSGGQVQRRHAVEVAIIDA